MVRVEGVSKSYGHRLVLQGIDLVVEPGEILALLGPNGAGKSTLLKAIVGLLLPSKGSILIDGQRLDKAKRQALSRIGFVPQRVAFPRHLSIQQIMSYYARLKGVPTVAIPKSLKRVGLEREAHRQVGELSGGTLQRLGLAQAILASPPLLVLDEPTVGLDPQVSCEFRALLSDLNHEGVTVILSSHLLGEIERLADRVAILKEGRILIQDTIPHLLTASDLPANLWVRLASGREQALSGLGKAGILFDQVGPSFRFNASGEQALVVLDTIRREGAEIEAFWTTTPTLEEVFRWVVEKEER